MSDQPARDQDVSRRRFVQLATASAIMLAEAGRVPPAGAEDKFIFASTGGSWGDGIKSSFVTKPDFEKRFKVTATHAAQLESVAASKIIASCGTPTVTVSTHGQAEAVVLAVAAGLHAYILAPAPEC